MILSGKSQAKTGSLGAKISVSYSGVSVECGTDVREVIVDEDLLKTVNTAEIFKAVILSASHVSGIDHLEDNMAEVVRGVDTPVGKDERAEHAKGLESEESDAFQQFGAGNMAGFFRA